MLESVEGIFRDGRVELLEAPSERAEAHVIVTFLPPTERKDIPVLPLTVGEAADLRARLHSFAEDWNHPDMDVYDVL